MQILQTGQRLTLSSPALKVQLSNAASAAIIVALTESGEVVSIDLAEHPLGTLLSAAQVGTLGLDLSRVPANVHTVQFFHPSGASGEVIVTSGQDTYGYENEPGCSGEQVRLIELYRRAGEWKLYAAGESVGSLADVHSSMPGLLLDAQEKAKSSKTAVLPVAPLTPRSPAPSAAAQLTLNKQASQAKLLSLAKDQAPAMVPVIEQARLTLQKAGLDALTFEVVLILDVSASMTGLFRSGQVQRLVERSLAVAARLDDNGEVPVTLFGTHARAGGTVDLSTISSYVQKMNFNYDGGTLYAPAIRAVIENAAQASWPTLVLFVTDGENSDPREAEQAMTLASREAVFFKFLALGAGPFRFLERLDTMPGRTVDNANFAQINDLSRTSDAQLFDLIIQEISDWLPAARKAGVLTADNRPNRSPAPQNHAGPPAPTDARPWWRKLLS